MAASAPVAVRGASGSTTVALGLPDCPSRRLPASSRPGPGVAHRLAPRLAPSGHQLTG